MMCLQQWNAHFFLLTATKLYYTDETSVLSQNDTIDEDEDVEEKEEEDNVTNAHMEVSNSLCLFLVCYTFFVTGRICRRQLCRYCFYSRAYFGVFRPTGATRCTDQGQIWH